MKQTFCHLHQSIFTSKSRLTMVSPQNLAGRISSIFLILYRASIQLKHLKPFTLKVLYLWQYLFVMTCASIDLCNCICVFAAQSVCQRVIEWGTCVLGESERMLPNQVCSGIGHQPYLQKCSLISY